MANKELGKITGIKFGIGGYQDAQLGLTVDLGGRGWGVSDFRGCWEREPDIHCKWTRSDQDASYASVVRFIGTLLKQANKTHLNQLVGVPVEVTFENRGLIEWRILDEVL